ncbi:hypothetical protein [Nocardia jiangsuensis]|uniref:Aromatic-ring opening dioxygenase LigAB LigA subunit n=1 Tax=Nocardia jiangsuensis TaxID=1691563 RepID=A0ABV8DP85_9NOCA
MSVLGLTKLAWDLEHVDGLLDSYRANPDTVLAGYDIDAGEAVAVAELDAHFLRADGMNPVALRNLLVLLGIPHGRLYTHAQPESPARHAGG